MRSAKAQDYWNTAYKRAYSGRFLEFDLNGLNSLKEIRVPSGILAICGLNGAGKSTIIAALKDIIGISLSDYDIHKLASTEVKAVFSNNGVEITCSNRDGKRLMDQGWDLEKICYLDSAQNTAVQDFFIRQTNLEELLEQYEEYDLAAEEIEELNGIVGKRYRTCSVRELEETDGAKAIPFCKATVDDIEYDSRSMGSGEHFLFYLFWRIKNIEKGTILIIEEPETYISISSQVHFVDYLAKQMAEKGVTVILTTHSPYILKQIKNENICIVNRVRNSVSIMIPNENHSAETLLGMKPSNKGTFFVEDRVAADFLSVLLEDCAPYLLREYSIDIASGESGITERLHFPQSEKIKYNFIGVYDGDMRDRLSAEKLNWSYCFLPGAKPIEVLFQDFAEHDEGIERLSALLQKEKEEVFSYMSTLEGIDYHDWFEELRKLIGVDGKTLVRTFYFAMKNDVFSPEEFIAELLSCLS